MRKSLALLGGETMNTAKFIQLAGPAAEGHVASTPGAPLESRAQGRSFAQRCRGRHAASRFRFADKSSARVTQHPAFRRYCRDRIR